MYLKDKSKLNIYNIELSESYTEEQMISSQGAAPPQDGKPQTWKQETLEDPNILMIILKPLTTLTAVKEHLTPSKFSNLEAALRDYCLKLLLDGHLTSCELPNDDPELPSSRYLDSKLKVFSYINYIGTPATGL